MRTVSPFNQLAGSGIAAAVPTVLWDHTLSSCIWGQCQLQGGPAPIGHLGTQQPLSLFPYGSWQGYQRRTEVTNAQGPLCYGARYT